jgi:uncharacterized LabA/DUF88 family protein
VFARDRWERAVRVSIFFDGKNFHAGYRATTDPAVRLDLPKLASWLVERAGGSTLWGAHYYTGIERGDEAITSGQQGLAKFLTMLEVQPGFFVHRFGRKVAKRTCPRCGEEIRFSHEKEVDTTMVADMLRLAAVDAFDILVLVSGDADLAPAVENVRELGKKVYVATWGRASLAARLRQAAFDHIDLETGLEAFRRESSVSMAVGETLVAAADLPVPTGSTDAIGGTVATHGEPLELAPVPLARIDSSDSLVVGAASAAQAAFVSELERAERKFAGGYVGVSYFLKSWRSNLLDPAPEVRQRLLDALVDAGKVTIYDALDGSKAMRRA